MSIATERSIEACLFDAYGTLFDVHAATATVAQRIGTRWQAFSAHWRERQLQYSWIRGLTGRHADFWQVTCDALDHALEAYDLDPALHREPLLMAYRRLGAYPDVLPAIDRLRAMGLRCGILSNGSPDMLADAVGAAGLADHLDPVLSVESVGRYKPAPEVYAMAAEQLDLAPAHVLFVSSNGWDAFSAKAYGFRVAWCNRAGLPAERLPDPPDAIVASLDELPTLAESLTG